MKIGHRTKIISLIALPIASLALFGFTNPQFLGMTVNGVRYPQSTVPLTQQQSLHIERSITDIITPNGDFVRTHSLGNFPSDEISYSPMDIPGKNIQELIFPFGIFMKTPQTVEKAQQLADPNWAKDHHYQPQDGVLIHEALQSIPTTGTPTTGTPTTGTPTTGTSTTSTSTTGTSTTSTSTTGTSATGTSATGTSTTGTSTTGTPTANING